MSILGNMKKNDPFPKELPFTSLLKIFCFKFALINLCIIHLFCGQCGCETNTKWSISDGVERHVISLGVCAFQGQRVQSKTPLIRHIIPYLLELILYFQMHASRWSLCTTNIFLRTPNTRLIEVIKIQSMPPSVLELNELYISLLSFISFCIQIIYMDL